MNDNERFTPPILIGSSRRSSWCAPRSRREIRGTFRCVWPESRLLLGLGGLVLAHAYMNRLVDGRLSVRDFMVARLVRLYRPVPDLAARDPRAVRRHVPRPRTGPVVGVRHGREAAVRVPDAALRRT